MTFGWEADRGVKASSIGTNGTVFRSTAKPKFCLTTAKPLILQKFFGGWSISRIQFHDLENKDSIFSRHFRGRNPLEWRLHFGR